MMNFMNLYCGVCFFPRLTSPTAKPLVSFCLMIENNSSAMDGRWSVSSIFPHSVTPSLPSIKESEKWNRNYLFHLFLSTINPFKIKKIIKIYPMCSCWSSKKNVSPSLCLWVEPFLEQHINKQEFFMISAAFQWCQPGQDLGFLIKKSYTFFSVFIITEYVYSS